jgi:hypothetical protein
MICDAWEFLRKRLQLPFHVDITLKGITLPLMWIVNGAMYADRKTIMQSVT